MNHRDLTTTTHRNGPPSGGVRRFACADADVEALVGRLADEMAEAWDTGARPLAEHFLERVPHLCNTPAAVMELLYEEVFLRHQYDEPVDRQEILQRFPAFETQVDILLHCARALEAAAVPEAFPLPGETIGDFHLLAELGRGGQGRVFVASQLSLGGRPVVVKVTPCNGHEHLSLARLQHTHIVPLLSAADLSTRRLRVLCMPYFGGSTFAALLAGLGARPMHERNGQQILQVLDEAAKRADVRLTVGADSAGTFLQRATYVQAMSWIGACLAEALQYAHDRGLVHLDVKPSNILLTADHQPMLLDFHLARPPLESGDALVRFGGTPVYMSPEQRAAMTSLQLGDRATAAIDGRSDIYSLGLVLYEALGGPVQDEKASAFTARPLHRCNRQVPRGLADIIGKCLSARPSDRYAEAGALAADLWNHLHDLPLQGVANRSLRERWSKWRRRRPHLVPLVGMFAALVAAVVGACIFLSRHVGARMAQARTALDNGQAQIAARQFADAETTLQRGLDQLDGVPGHAGLHADVTDRLRVAKRGRLACELHHIADRLRFLDGQDASIPANLQSLERHCRTLWDKRDIILGKGSKLDAATEQRAATDLLELAILGSGLRVRLADNKDAARREALCMLEQAEALAGGNAVLYHERCRHAEALGLSDVAREARRCGDACPPRTAWEHYALGRCLLRDGDLGAAAARLERALALEPHGLWPNFYHGVCSYRIGRFDDAALAFTACAALAPQAPACVLNRGIAFVAAGRTERAMRDFNRALELDPACAEASLQRGLLYLRDKKLSEAATDLQRALQYGADPGGTHLHLARVSLAQKNRAAAISHLEQSRNASPQHAEAAQLLQALQNQR